MFCLRKMHWSVYRRVLSLSVGLVVIILSACGEEEQPRLPGVPGKVVSGYVLDKSTNEPIVNARILLMAQDIEEYSDSSGHFYLGVDDCANCVPGKDIRFNISSNAENGYGYHDIVATIDKNSRVILQIEKNNLLAIRGQVFDAKSQEPIENVTVACVVGEATSTTSGAENPQVLSDEYGRFVLILNRPNAAALQHTRLIFQDANNRYMHKSELIDVRSDLQVFLENKKRAARSVQVKRGIAKSGIRVSAGEKVKLRASGRIKVTPISKSIGPEGQPESSFSKPTSVLGFLETVNEVASKIEDGYPSGALMYKLSSEGAGAWKLCGRGVEFVASRNGTIQFSVNDASPNDNTGSFQVNIEFP